MATESNETVGMVFKQPWQGYVPGERAGFSEDTCHKLYDAGVAAYLDANRNIAGLGSAALSKLKDLLGIDNTGAPVRLPEPQGFREVPGPDLLTREPVGSPAGKSGPAPDFKPDAPKTAEPAGDGTPWPPPGVGDNPPSGGNALPEELIGKKAGKK